MHNAPSPNSVAAAEGDTTTVSVPDDASDDHDANIGTRHGQDAGESATPTTTSTIVDTPAIAPPFAPAAAPTQTEMATPTQTEVVTYADEELPPPIPESDYPPTGIGAHQDHEPSTVTHATASLDQREGVADGATQVENAAPEEAVVVPEQLSDTVVQFMRDATGMSFDQSRNAVAVLLDYIGTIEHGMVCLHHLCMWMIASISTEWVMRFAKRDVVLLIYILRFPL